MFTNGTGFAGNALAFVEPEYRVAQRLAALIHANARIADRRDGDGDNVNSRRRTPPL